MNVKEFEENWKRTVEMAGLPIVVQSGDASIKADDYKIAESKTWVQLKYKGEFIGGLEIEKIMRIV
jgi:glutaredoxin-related protein